jgi:hypothetical protein
VGQIKVPKWANLEYRNHLVSQHRLSAMLTLPLW